ncbi:hypothetical protein K7432_002371 [Basidiobolus ranarum]|uniref:Glycosyltransferase 2-like domain-containing protein n=1 Tax=Basidiobolus ranarum TaxID=34480 RepID=A0ABR2W8D2_9FUNG
MDWVESSHAYLAAFALLVLTLGGLYAGILYPLGYLCKIRVFTEGYAHKSYFSTILLSLLVGLAIPGALLGKYASDGGFHNSDPKAFFQFVWWACNYWRYYQNFKADVFVYANVYMYLCFSVLLSSLFGIFARWKPFPDPETEPASQRHLFLIVAHNSSDKLRETVLALLKHVAPHQVFISDNGSSVEEIEATDSLCLQMSNEYYTSRGLEPLSQIMVSHIRYGNKTLAQYHAIYDLHSRYHAGQSESDIITILDDDVILPTYWPSKSIEKQFEDPTKILLAYPLSAENHSATLMATIQQIEYLSGDVGRYFASYFGTQLFASGAISTWRLDQLKEVLSRHCTIFNGEDLEMGYLVHKLSGRYDAKLGVSCPSRIGYVRDCIVATVVPYCPMHWYDLLPDPLRRKLNPAKCKCEEHSFLNQRMRSWDPAGCMFMMRWIRVLFAPGGLTYGPKWFARTYSMWKLISLGREIAQLIGIIMSFAKIRSLEDFTKLMVFYADAIIVCWAGIIFYNVWQSRSCGRLGLAWRPDLIVCYPILFEIPFTIIARSGITLYILFYYIIRVRFPDDIRLQLEKDSEKSTEILTSQYKATVVQMDQPR